jgi:hypothetical protein
MNQELISFVLNWVLYLALYPVGFFWLRRAYRIFIKRDYSEVALKRGESPPNPKGWAPLAGLVNLAAGGIAVWLVICVPMGRYTFDRWIEISGITLWMKILADYIISRQAHPFTLGKAKKSKAEPKVEE